MKKLKPWVPLILTAALAMWFLSTLTPPPDTNFAFNEFSQLPLVFNGRLKPMDSLARNSLLEIREKQTLDTEPWKGLERRSENHLGQRMAHQRDDEFRRGRRLACLPRWTNTRPDHAAQAAGAQRPQSIRTASIIPGTRSCRHSI